MVLNIIFIISYLDSLGGTERVATMLANGLVRQHDVTMLSRQGGDHAFALDKQVNDIQFAGSSVSFIRQCRQYVRQHQPDVVIIHTMSKLTPTLLLGGLKARQIWSMEHIAYEFHSWPWRLLRKLCYGRVHKVVALTQADAQQHRRYHPNVAVVANPCPFPIKDTPIATQSRTIVSVGRLTWQKGYDLLLAAWAQVEHQYPYWQLHIYGEGEERASLETQIKQLGLQNLHLKGNSQHIMTAYDEAAFYVMSSRFEGFGMVLIEAQSRGLPLVSFDCPSGPAEIIDDGQDGFLVDDGDVEKLAAQMMVLMSDDALRQAYSKQALASAQNYTGYKIIEQWLNLLGQSPDAS